MLTVLQVEPGEFDERDSESGGAGVQLGPLVGHRRVRRLQEPVHRGGVRPQDRQVELRRLHGEPRGRRGRRGRAHGRVKKMPKV